MRFVTFRINKVEGLAVYNDGETYGLLCNDDQHPGDLSSLIAAGPKALADAYRLLLKGSRFDQTELEFLPPIMNPGKIICIGLNYLDHATEGGFKPPVYPSVFGRFSSTLVGHLAPIVRPAASEQLDYEGELVAIIGRGGRHISFADALGYVAGYSIFNEGSVRDYQFKTSQWTMGKNFDNTGAFGPCFVTADELPLGAKGLRIETRLNGEIVQSASTADMIFDVATLVSVLSEAITLDPGDVIVTGTPSGIGWFREPKLLMKPGDVCEVEIEGIGILVNPIAQEPKHVHLETMNVGMS